MHALNNLAYLAASDDRKAVERYTTKRLDHSRRIGDPLFLVDSLLVVAAEAAECADWATARALIEETAQHVELYSLTGLLG
jgi:hypothetical protein